MAVALDDASLHPSNRTAERVQIEEKALNSPAVGCVTTTCGEAMTTPPPTGTSATAASDFPPAGDGSADDELDGAGVDASGLAAAESPPELPPHAARNAEPAPAPRASPITRRRVGVTPGAVSDGSVELGRELGTVSSIVSGKPQRQQLEHAVVYGDAFAGQFDSTDDSPAEFKVHNS